MKTRVRGLWEIRRGSAAAEAQRELGWVMRPVRESFVDTAVSLIEKGIVVPRAVSANRTHPPGTPSLRPAAWRAVWGGQRTNPVYAARYQHLTGRADNKLAPIQAQAVIAASILRHLHAVITTGCRWDPRTATHGTRTTTPSAIAA